MRNVSRGASLLSVLAALSLGVSACGGSSSSGDTAGSAPAATTATSSGTSSSGTSSSGTTGGSGAALKFGFMGALTGPNAQLGINIKNGAKLAIDAYNASSPAAKIDLVDYDTAGDPAQATTLVAKVASDKIVAVIGPAFSGESKNAVPTLEEAKIPNISASATNALLSTNGWKFWHRVLANDDVQAPGDAGFITGGLAATKVAVIDDQSDYGKGLADAVAKSLGSKASLTDSIDPKADDYSSTVNKIKSAKVNVVFYGGYYAEAAKFIKQLRDGGVTDAKFVSGDGSLDQGFIDGAKSAADGAFLSCTCATPTASTDPAVVKFVADYKAAYGSDPATYSAEGYDAATAFIMALKAGKTSSEDINTFLSSLSFQGVSKPIKWSATGELAEGTVFMNEVKGGKIISLGDYKTAKPQ